MPAYAYKININYSKLWVYEDHEERIEGDTLTVAALLELVGPADFTAEETPTGYIIRWRTRQRETDEERARRIAIQEAYNEEYKRRHAK